MADIAPKLVELSADKLRSLHERLHKLESSAATLELHHLTTTEMARRGVDVSADEWADTRIQVDYLENVDLESLGTSLPLDQVQQVIKSTGTNVADIRTVLTVYGYALEIVTEDNLMEKMIRQEKGKWVVYDRSGMHPLGTYGTKEEAMDRIAEIEYFRKFNPNHDEIGRFSSGTHGAGSASITAEPGSKKWGNQIGDALIEGQEIGITAKGVGKFLHTMAERGDNPDITNLQVNGHTLFGGDGLGIKRKDMPQIPANRRAQFLADMADKGIETTLDKVEAGKLKPSQSEISATKTARLYEHFKADGIPTDKAILVSKDGFVVDGHHHWAAAAAMGLMGKNSTIPVIRMNVNIREALAASKQWATDNGIAAQDMDSKELPLDKSSDDSDYFVKFNPHHDEIGRFTSGPGGIGGAAGGFSDGKNAIISEAERRAGLIETGRNPGIPRDAEGRVINPDATGGYKAGIPESVNIGEHEFTPEDSLWHHLVPDGRGGYEISGERALLHSQIVTEATANVPESASPTFTMLGGGPASGKTSAVKAGIVTVPSKTEAVHINADDVKALLPENPRMSQSKNDGDFFAAAAFAHEESSIIAKQIQSRAISNGQNIVLDGTGDSKIAKLAAKVESAVQKGYKVNGVYVTVPTDIAWGRAVKRALGPEKRYVPESVVRETHRDVSNTFKAAVEGRLFDSVTLIDKSDPNGKAILIGSGTKSSGFTIADQGLYDTFLAKGNE
jgi:hypothetical protein